MNLATILKLGRVSNLPTVWTNAAAGMVLAGSWHTTSFVIIGIALTAFYVGGMWLNDAFDAEVDASEKKDRPIPSGEANRLLVFIVGYVLLAVGVALSFLLNSLAGIISFALAVSIILYDWLHKKTLLSPVLMGITRFLCYIVAGSTLLAIPMALVWAAFGLFAYIVGLTYAAKQENFNKIGSIWPLLVLIIPIGYGLYSAWPNMAALGIWLSFLLVAGFAVFRLFRRSRGDVPKAVVTLIAGTCLYDGVFLASSGNLSFAIGAVFAFILTLGLQRLVSGT